MEARRYFAAVLAAVLSAGCALHVPPPAGAPQHVQAGGDPWTRVLERSVDETGRIDFAGLVADHADLDAAVARIAAESPRSAPASFPAPAARLAWYLNAYNALAMYGVVREGVPTELGTIKVRFFYRNRFRMGGEWISLYALENSIIRPLGDPRVHFALNCMVRGCPRLPREPFTPERLDQQLDAAARVFFSENRNVALDSEGKTVRFSEILRFYTKDFLAKAPTLIAYANLYRSDPIPSDWEVEFIPYDWTLNSQ